MKNILIALALVGFTCFNAEAQNKPKKVCELPKGKVCKKHGNNVSCYKTKYAHDFAVCKGEFGYFVCCEQPNATNSTHPPVNRTAARDYPNPMANNDENYDLVAQAQENAAQAMVAPQSQSYPVYAMNSATSYEGYYNRNRKHYIKVCYAGENVAELNRAAYHGCSTPAYDGPEKNKARNVNSNNMIDDIPPIDGQIR